MTINTDTNDFVVFQEPSLGQILQLKHKSDSESLQISNEKKTIARVKKTSRSWRDNFKYKAETKSQSGLRAPQIGALHAIQSHWTTSTKPATIVMPTGTGKTEVMVSTLIAGNCQKLLVIVPTAALRKQIGGKFLSLGILKQFGIVSEEVINPIVGILEHRTDDKDYLDRFIAKCNVVVTTMSIVAHLNEELQELLAYRFSHLFIDEAHHVAATTWDRFRKNFIEQNKSILQFTATPFRNDGKHIGGTIIYQYPLRLAQENGYFKNINFTPIKEFDLDLADRKLAEAGIEQLTNDFEQHILMARVNTQKRANEVYEIYKEFSEFNPTIIHSSLTTKQQNEARKKLISKETRIIVCVDMLGEGFDLPELKIAVFHDIKKSLSITLQLAGRFTRTRNDLGDATFIANIADNDVREELSRLYQQDADWNTLLEKSAEEAVMEQVGLHEFIKDFHNLPIDIPLQNLRPAISTVVYKVENSAWHPDNFSKGIGNIDNYEKVLSDHNSKTDTLVIVTGKKEKIDWIKQEEFFEWNWESYIVFFDKSKKLLFIHSSSNKGHYRKLAEVLAKSNVEIIKGPEVFKAFDGINRLILYNVGLRKQLGRQIRFRMHAGSDVREGLTDAAKRNTTKSNIFGVGFQNGEKVSLGCSYKGRLWSHSKGTIKNLHDWCSDIGDKITDPNLDPEKVLEGTLIPKVITNFPSETPILIEWPDYIFHNEGRHTLEINSKEISLLETEINISKFTKKYILFNIVHNQKTYSIEYKLSKINGQDSYKFSNKSGKVIKIKRASKEFKIEEFLFHNPPLVFFSNGAMAEGNDYIELKKDIDPYSVGKIQTLDWTNINIRKESIGPQKDMLTVQGKMIEQLKSTNCDVIFNDDGSGEIADIVAFKFNEDNVFIDLYHCKYSSADTPGARIQDLYEVCGQAQKSVRWREDIQSIFLRIFKRNAISMRQNYSRFEAGNEQMLTQIQEMSKIKSIQFKIHIVQPGLSKNLTSESQKELLAVTENYLQETFQVPLNVIASE